MQLSYTGHRVLLLGGSSAIGLNLAELLQAQGLEVILTYCSDQGRQNIMDRFPELGTTCLDFFDKNTFDGLTPVLKNGIDYLVDLAQADHEGLLAAANMDQAEMYFTAHVTGRLQLLKKIVRPMLAKRCGRLIHVSSTAAALPGPGQGFYATAKNAAESLYLSLGVELGSRGITSLNLRLGLVDSGRGKQFLNDHGYRQNMAEKIVTISQVAHTLCFFLSDQARALTCTTITMDAGVMAIKYANIAQEDSC